MLRANTKLELFGIIDDVERKFASGEYGCGSDMILT